MSDEPPPDFADDLGRALFPEDGAAPLPPGMLARIADSYDFTLRRLGTTPRAVLWRSRWSQRARYRTLLRVVEPDRRCPGLVIADLGCGYGALWEMIRRKRYMVGGRYLGYDMSARMLAAARDRIVDPRAEFIQATAPTEPADYTLASGTFGLRLDTPEDAWAEWVRDRLRRVAETSRRGFAFNLLDARGKDRRDTLFYGDPAEWAAFCRSAFGGSVEVVEDRWRADFAVLVRA